MNYLSLIGRENELFKEDILNNELNFAELIKNSKCLVIGGVPYVRCSTLNYDNDAICDYNDRDADGDGGVLRFSQ